MTTSELPATWTFTQIYLYVKDDYALAYNTYCRRRKYILDTYDGARQLGTTTIVSTIAEHEGDLAYFCLSRLVEQHRQQVLLVDAVARLVLEIRSIGSWEQGELLSTVPRDLATLKTELWIHSARAISKAVFDAPTNMAAQLSRVSGFCHMVWRVLVTNSQYYYRHTAVVQFTASLVYYILFTSLSLSAFLAVVFTFLYVWSHALGFLILRRSILRLLLHWYNGFAALFARIAVLRNSRHIWYVFSNSSFFAEI